MSDRNRARRANGDGSISEPRPGDGAIVLRVTASDGRRRKRIVHREQETPSQHRRRAERILREFAAEITANPAPVERWTVQRWAIERYLPSLVESRKPNTVASYRKVLETVVAPHVGSIALDRLTVDDVDMLDGTLAARGLSLVTRRHARGLLGRIVRHAKSKRIVPYDVTGDADRLAKDDRDRTKGTLQPEQVHAVLTAAKGTPWEPHLALLGLLGLRRGELLGLSWEAVDLDAATLRVERNMVTLPGGVAHLGTPKTKGSRRALRLSARMVAVLRQHRARQAELALAAGSDWSGTMVDDEGVTVSLVFTDEAGRPMPGHRLNDALERIATAAGVGHVNPHRFRHSAASLMIAEGMDLAAVGAVLGHASPAMTMSVYAHAIERTKAAATDSIAAAVGDW